jgi:hypothetical protein
LIGERKTIGQFVIDAHANQVLLDSEGDQPLRDRT